VKAPPRKPIVMNAYPSRFMAALPYAPLPKTIMRE
jgi:hypothetical protein